MAGPEAPSRPPNLLLIMADQLRQDALGVYGSWAPTPHIDELAASATVFDEALTVSPACQPARTSLALGEYPHNFGLWSNGRAVIPKGQPTWMSAIRDAGYDTSSFGKLHLAQMGPDVRQHEGHAKSLGFDTVNETLGPRGCLNKLSHMTQAWADAGVLDDYRNDLADRLAHDALVVRPSPLPLDLYYDVYVPSRAIEHLQTIGADRPWFCNVSFGGPHEPWDAPEPYASMFSPSDAPPAIADGDRAVQSAPYFIDEAKSVGGGRTPEQIAQMRANYAGAVKLIDDQVGRLVEVVKARGEWDNTVVILTSDHGEMNGDHRRVYKGTFYAAALDIPLVVRIPGVTSGARAKGPVELHDVGATLAELAGASFEHEQFARSLVPSCADPSDDVRSVALSEYQRDYLVSDGRYRLIVNRQAESVLLFDRTDDPDEQENHLRSNAGAEVEARLRDELLRAITTSQRSLRRTAKSPAFRRQKESARQMVEQANNPASP